MPTPDPKTILAGHRRATERREPWLSHWLEYWRLPSNDPARAAVDEKRGEFYAMNYGNGPAEFDAVGRMKEPALKRAVPEQPTSLKTPSGETVATAAGRVADGLARHANAFGETNAVKALQTGLNLLASAVPEDQKQRLGNLLKVDGDFGPKTGGALKTLLAANGVKAADEAVALGRVHRFATAERQRGNPGTGLEGLLGDAVEPLVAAKPVRMAAADIDTPAPSTSGGVMQETLNDLGAKSKDRPDGFEPIKVSGIFDRETEDAFRTVNALEGPDKLTRTFGENLGFV